MLLEKEVNSLIIEIIKEHEKINAGKGIEHSVVTLNVLKYAIYKASKMPNNEDTSFKVWKIRTIMDEYIKFLTNKEK